MSQCQGSRNRLTRRGRSHLSHDLQGPAVVQRDAVGRLVRRPQQRGAEDGGQVVEGHLVEVLHVRHPAGEQQGQLQGRRSACHKSTSRPVLVSNLFLSNITKVQETGWPYLEWQKLPVKKV